MKTQLTVLLCVLLAFSGSAHANINNSLKSFYNGIGTGANVTPAGVYQSQAGGNFTAGGLFMRTPSQTYNLITVTPPSLSSGCGGIDAYLGGFSFINKAQFTAMLRNIGNNAVGYAFNLALQTFAPQIYTSLNDLQNKIQKITDMSINSCESAQKAVDGIFGEISASSNYACKNLALSHGKASDEAAAIEYCKSPANARSVLNPASMSASEKDKIIIHKNILWAGLNKNSVLASDKEMKEYLMSLVGTITVNTSAGGTPETKYLPPLGSITNQVETIMFGSQGSSMPMYICTDTPCLKPISRRKAVIGISGYVRTALDDIRIKLENEAMTGGTAPLTTASKKLLTITSIPILKMMTNAVALGPSVALEIENELVTPITFNITAFYLDWAFQTAKEGIEQVNAPKDLYQRYINTIRDREKQFRSLKNSKRFMSSYEIIKKAQFLERMLIANLTPHFQEVLQYSKSF